MNTYWRLGVYVSKHYNGALMSVALGGRCYEKLFWRFFWDGRAR